jgi:hypothetical protein
MDNLGDIVLVAFAGFMRPDAERIVRYEDLAQVAPFVPLAHPILKEKEHREKLLVPMLTD